MKRIIILPLIYLIASCSDNGIDFVEPLSEQELMAQFVGVIDIDDVIYDWEVKEMHTNDYGDDLPDLDEYENVSYSRIQFKLFIESIYNGEAINDTLNHRVKVVLNYFDRNDQLQDESFRRLKSGPISFKSYKFLPDSTWQGERVYYNVNSPYVMYGAFPNEHQEKAGYSELFSSIRKRFDEL